MRTSLFATITAALCFTLVVVHANGQNTSSDTPALSHFDLDLVDKTLDPCQDFYQYACSKWNAANPIPADQVAWGTGSGLRYWNENILREAMDKAASQTGNRTDYEQKIGDYWAACMDEAGIEAAGTRDLKAGLERISQMRNKSELADQVAHLHQAVPGAWESDDNQTGAALLGFGQQQDYDDATKVVASIDQGGLGLPNRDFYIKDDAKSKEIRSAYQLHISKMLALAGDSPQQADADAKTIVAIETAMAQSQMDNVARRDPKNLNNKMSFAEVQALTPSFDWKHYVEVVGAPPSPPHYVVSSPQFFRGLEALIQQHPVDDWKVYLRWHLVHGSAPYLSKALVDENWNFYSHTLLGAKQQTPRWRRCVRAADRDLGMALGQAYVAVAFPPENKQRTVALIHDIEHALDQDIASLDWMQPATKEQAKIKLHAIEDKIDKIGKPVDRAEFGMTPPTINAYYNAQLNTINFPAGILQPPFFEGNMEDAVNYGAIGMVMGHEITHGFDDEGRKFDAQGNLRDWWTPADAKAYEQRGECIADEYSQEIPEAGVKQNGHLTQGEDTADNGGLRLALMALTNKLAAENKSVDTKEADGWTPRQKFFLSYANSWCQQYRPELMRTIVLTNPHSIPKYRVNNVVSNMPEFQQAFPARKACAWCGLTNAEYGEIKRRITRLIANAYF